jgi:hypothetical protein
MYKSRSETLQMLEEVYGKAAMKKTHVYEWHKRFRDGHVVSMTIHAAGSFELQQMTKNIEHRACCVK